MRRWVAELTGLLIGTALGALLLALYFPDVEAFVRHHVLPRPSPAIVATAPPPLPAPVAAPPSPVPPPRVVTAMAPPAPPPPLPPPLPLPEIRPAPLPTIVRPDMPAVPGETRRLPGMAYAGTGFFIAHDGSLLTAAHVVAGCTRAQIVSRHVAPAIATVLAVDATRDIALLRAAQVRPPAILPVGRAGGAGRVFVLGYPASAGMLVPEEDWAELRSDRVARTGGLLQASDGVWLETSRITHGYSGGPVLDPRNGTVVAIVRAEIEGPGLRRLALASGAHLATGPGGERLAAFVRREAPWIDLGHTLDGGEEPIAAARLATVHVICGP